MFKNYISNIFYYFIYFIFVYISVVQNYIFTHCVYSPIGGVSLFWDVLRFVGGLILEAFRSLIEGHVKFHIEKSDTKRCHTGARFS